MTTVETVTQNFRFFIIYLQYAEKTILYAHTAADTFFSVNGYHKAHSSHCIRSVFISISQQNEEVNRTVFLYDFGNGGNSAFFSHFPDKYFIAFLGEV
jgi:hypothetical protein